MTFPKRWMDDDAGKSPMRDVLRSGAAMDPPDGAEDAVWLALAAKIGTAGLAAGATAKVAASLTSQTTAAATTTAVTTTAATGAGAGVAVGGGILKAILFGALGGVLAVTGFTVLEPAGPSNGALGVSNAPNAPALVAPAKDRAGGPALQGPAQDTPPSAVRDAPRSSDPSPLLAVSAPPGETAAPSSGAVSPSAAPSSADPAGAAAPSIQGEAASGAPVPGSPEDRERLLREEREMLNQARTALRGGDTGGAMRLLEQARQKFPGGALGQEREALAIETLAKSGARDAASARAAAFIKAHPTSPHAARLQVFVLP